VKEKNVPVQDPTIPPFVSETGDPDRRAYLLARVTELKAALNSSPEEGEAVLERMEADGYRDEAAAIVDYRTIVVLAYAAAQALVRGVVETEGPCPKPGCVVCGGPQ
jgi:hypothetical protein